MTESQEWELIERCKNGNVDAYTELVRKYQHVIYNCALRILGNPDDAADITQIAFLKLFKNIGSFDSNRTFFSWMYRIAVNEAIDHKRKNRHFETYQEDNLESEMESPEDSLQKSVNKDQIQASLMRLPDDFKVVLILRHYSELSYRQIGDILEIPEKTVRSRLYSARQHLKDLLQMTTQPQ
jgi:RNA polymerase sigma-70 factor (ECF subfamily)